MRGSRKIVDLDSKPWDRLELWVPGYSPALWSFPSCNFRSHSDSDFTLVSLSVCPLQSIAMKRDRDVSKFDHEEDDYEAADALMQHHRHEDKGEQPRNAKQGHQLRNKAHFLLVQAFLILLYTAVFALLWKWSRRNDGIVYCKQDAG